MHCMVVACCALCFLQHVYGKSMWPWLGTGAAGMLEVFKTHIFKVKIVNPYKENAEITCGITWLE
jgi:hypothetical protein